LDKKFKRLSPGIRIKILLGVLSLTQYDLIIWDEPTNHLDVMTQYILKQALLDYKGALILVTHDVGFLKDKKFLIIKM
jgi:ATP-binding cassette subfamily F protein 3